MLALRWELEQTARSDITFFQKMGFHQKIKFINKNAINYDIIRFNIKMNYFIIAVMQILQYVT